MWTYTESFKSASGESVSVVARDQVRVAVVGCGYWGRNLVRSFAELGALVAVVDTDPDNAAALAAQHSVQARTLDDVLADESIHAMVVAAPAVEHGTLGLRCLDAGKHLFVEKPLALDVPMAQALVAKAAEVDRQLMVGHLLRYHPAFLAVADMVRNGSLGDLRYLYSNRLNLGKIRREENILWSFAPHDLSMLLALVGEEPSEVSAVGSTFLSQDVPDVTTTHLEFPGGQRAHVFVSWLHPFKEQRLVVVGSDAMVVFDDLQPWDSKLTLFEHRVDWDGSTPIPVKADATPISLEQAEPLRLECEHFLDCIATGAIPRTDGHEGVRVLTVLAAAQASLAAGSAMVDAERHGPEGLDGLVGSSARATPGGLAEPGSSTPSDTGADVGQHPDSLIHESAYIDDGVTIGKGTKVWHFSHVLSGSSIGAGCTLGQNVVVGPDVTVGDRCRIQNNVSVYAGVTLEEGVFCGPSCVFTNVYNPRAEVSRKDEFMTTVVRRGATIGANATIVCGNEIGEYAFIGAGAVVAGPVPPHALVVGSPARQIGWMSHEGERLGEDLVCPRSGQKYEIRDGRLVLTDAVVGVQTGNA